jgi:hypothetical protein
LHRNDRERNAIPRDLGRRSTSNSTIRARGQRSSAAC